VSKIKSKLKEWNTANQSQLRLEDLLHRNINIFFQISENSKDGLFSKNVKYDTGAAVCLFSAGTQPVAILTAKHCAYNDRGNPIPIQAISCSDIFGSQLVGINPGNYLYLELNKEFCYKNRGDDYLTTSYNKYQMGFIHDLVLIVKKDSLSRRQAVELLSQIKTTAPKYSELYSMMYDNRIKKNSLPSINPNYKQIEISGEVKYSRLFDWYKNLIFDTETSAIKIDCFDSNPFYRNALTVFLPDTYFDNITQQELYNPKGALNEGRSGSIALFNIAGVNCENKINKYSFLALHVARTKFNSTDMNLKKYPINQNWSFLYQYAFKNLYHSLEKIDFKVPDPAVDYFIENNYIEAALFAPLTFEVLDFWIKNLS
jgi:hypothetical protein